MTKQPTLIFAGPTPERKRAPRLEAGMRSRRSMRAYDGWLATLVRDLRLDGRRAASETQVPRHP